MKPSEARKHYGATHYTTMRDGVIPQLYYKIGTVKTTEGCQPCIEYLTFCNLWHGASLAIDSPALVAIPEEGNNESR